VEGKNEKQNKREGKKREKTFFERTKNIKNQKFVF